MSESSYQRVGIYSSADVLRVAVNVFCEQGYQVTTLREVAHALDIKEANLHVYFKSKEEMLWAIVSRIANLFLLQARSVPLHLAPPEQLRLLIHHHLDVLANEAGSVCLFGREWRCFSGPRLDALQSMHRLYEGFFYRTIEAGCASHVFTTPGVALTTSYVLSALYWLHPGPYPVSTLAFEQIAHQYWLLTCHTLQYTTPDPDPL